MGQDQLPYHTHCHKELHHPRCYVCKGFIPSRGNGSIEWRENPFWRLPHCPGHAEDGTPQCCSCNRLQAAGEEGVTLSDGRLLCLDCLDTVVVDTKDCQPLYDEVRGQAAVQQHLQLKGLPPLSFGVVPCLCDVQHPAGCCKVTQTLSMR